LHLLIGLGRHKALDDPGARSISLLDNEPFGNHLLERTPGHVFAVYPAREELEPLLEPEDQP
jgi:hypothetical protein